MRHKTKMKNPRPWDFQKAVLFIQNPAGFTQKESLFVLQVKMEMCCTVEDDDEQGLDDVGYEIAVPEQVGGEARHEPQHGDDHERQGQ